MNDDEVPQPIEASLAEFGAAPLNYQRIFDELAVGVVVQRPDGSISACNQAAERILGLSSDQMAGRTSIDPRWRSVHDDGSPFPGETHPAMVALQTGEVQRDVVMGVHTPDGALRWITINAHPVLGDGGPKASGVVTTFVDITESRATADALALSERRFRAIVQNASDIITVLDASGTWQYSSPGGSQLLGWPEGYSPEGGIFSLVHPDDIEVAARAFSEVLDGSRGPNDPVVFRVRRADDSYISLETVGQKLVDDPAIGGVLLISRDITDRLRAQEQVAAARDAALEALQAKREFIAVVSHELRTPMHAVLGLSELLVSSALDAEQRVYVDSIRRSVQSLSAVVDDILDFTRAESGRLALHPVTFNVGGLIDDVITIFGPAADEKGLVLSLDLAPSVPPAVFGDPDRVRQILTNLVSNAIKFTDAGSVKVEVSAPSVTATDITMRLVVRDTGIGISADAEDRLFEPFEQGEGAMSRRYGGTGLGLAICRQLAALMRGSVTVESTVGFGSTFTAEIVLGAVQPTRTPMRVIVPRRTAATEEHRQILVVEDNEVNQLLVRKQLETLDYEATVVGDGRTALEYLGKQHWDAVLLDVQLPEMDGLEVARQIRATQPADQPRVPVIAMTASAMAGDRDACLAAGMDDYLAKPVGIEALRTMLDRWVQGGEALPRVEPAKPAGSLDALTEELGGDRQTVTRMAATFLGELDQRRSAILDASDAPSFGAAAHALASAAASLSLTGLFNACRAAEQAAKQGQQFDRSTHEQAIEAAITRSTIALKEWLAGGTDG